MTRKQTPKIGILVEITREFGRGICRGISELARQTGAFSPYLISPADIGKADVLRKYDGFVARVMNDRIAKALADARRPVVDIYYDKPRNGFAIVKTRHSRIGAIAAEHFLERRFKNFAFCGFAGGRFPLPTQQRREMPFPPRPMGPDAQGAAARGQAGPEDGKE